MYLMFLYDPHTQSGYHNAYNDLCNDNILWRWYLAINGSREDVESKELIA
jgi:hypothetical protein